MINPSLASTQNATPIAESYVGLQDINDVPPLGEDDRRCLEALREVLIRHNALDRFGISLLHTHFPIYEGEVLVEECDPVTRTLSMRPFKKGDVSQGQVVETSWRLSTSQAMAVCQTQCLRFQPDPNGVTQHRVEHVRGG